MILLDVDTILLRMPDSLSDFDQEITDFSGEGLSRSHAPTEPDAIGPDPDFNLSMGLFDDPICYLV